MYCFCIYSLEFHLPTASSQIKVEPMEDDVVYIETVLKAGSSNSEETFLPSSATKIEMQ